MGPLPDSPISDPLLRPDSAPRDATGAPVRAPLGNSIRTLLVFVLLVLVGMGAWWVMRPDDMVDRLGGREWVIVEVDGVAVTNAAGLAPAFVLDGSGQIRAPRDCNVATGAWTYDEQRDRLSIEWHEVTELSCPEGWPTSPSVAGGEVGVDDGVLRVRSELHDIVAVSLVDRAVMPTDGLEGTWTSGETSIEIGRRGLFRVDDCQGEWAPSEIGDTITIRFDDLHSDDCDLDPLWRDDTPIVPVAHGDSVFLRRDRSIFPLDRAIVRLDAAP